MNINPNDPAFPIKDEAAGLTIRQEFAKAAMQGLCADRHTSDTQGSPEMIASMAAAVADALINELNKTQI